MNFVTPEQIKVRLQNGENLNLVDVREPHENAEFNIGGLLLPLGKIQTMQIEDIEDLKDQEIICYCRSGQRSMNACMMLETFGFTNVSNLTGGMLGWKELYGG
jgi:rhodanese-related sulfurtransferase